jgi:hypothetical protein
MEGGEGQNLGDEGGETARQSPFLLATNLGGGVTNELPVGLVLGR